MRSPSTVAGQSPSVPSRSRDHASTGRLLIAAAAIAGAAVLPAAAQAPAAVGESQDHGYLQRRWASTDVGALAAALRDYRQDHGAWPTGTLSESLAPTYLSPVPAADPWGTPYRFEATEDAPRVVSAGPDRAFGTDDDVMERVVEGTRLSRAAARRREVESADQGPPSSGGRMEVAHQHLKLMARALEAFHAAHGRYPVADDLDRLQEALVPAHLASSDWSNLDPWGQPWRYRTADTGECYSLASLGADGERESLVAAEAGPVADPARDLVVASGRFVRWPASEGAPAVAARARHAAPAPTLPPPPDDEGRRERTIGRLRELAKLLEAYRKASGRYPEQDDAVRLVEQDLKTGGAATDGWGTPLAYVSRASGSGYLLVSAGADRRLDRSLESYFDDAAPGGAAGDDIVVRDGAFPG